MRIIYESGVALKASAAFSLQPCWLQRQLQIGSLVDTACQQLGGAMQYNRELIEDLREIAILYHASSLLSYKLQEVLDRHIPHLGETCMERGCVDYTLA
jgi:hypothetical protein